MNLQTSPQKSIEKNNLGQHDMIQQSHSQRNAPPPFTNSRSNALTSNNHNNMMTLTSSGEQANPQIIISNPLNQAISNQKGVNLANGSSNNNTNAAANTNSNANNIEVKVHPDLILSQSDFEKKFTKTADKCLNKCDFYETWKYEMNGEIYIVKKYLKLDDMKWKKIVNSYNLQYHLACSSSLFLKPFKLVAFSVAVTTSAHHNRLGNQNAIQGGHHQSHQQQHQNQFNQQILQQQQIQQRRWHLYVIYPYSNDYISLDKIYSTPSASLSDIDMICIAIQLFKIGQLCAEKNFPLINWKFSNLLLQLKQVSIPIFQSQQQQQSQQSLSNNMLKSNRLQQDAPTTPVPQSNSSLKIVESSLKIMDLYDYFGIENRDSNDLLLPPELRQEQRKQSITVHFEDHHGTLEQSSIYMTGMMLALLLKKKFEEIKKGDSSIQTKVIQKPLASPQAGVSNNPQNQALTKKGGNNYTFPQNEDSKKKSQQSNTMTSSSNSDSSVMNVYSIIDQIIETQAQVNPFIHALAMIVKITINPYPKERPTFSSGLDVIRSIFGEIIDFESNSEQTKYKKSEKYIILLLEFTNTLLEQQDQESANIQLNRAKKIIIQKSKKYQLSPKVNAFYFFTTGYMYMLQGRLPQSVRQYSDGLREIQSMENQSEDLQDDLYFSLYGQILLQLGICSFKLNQCYKALLYIHECIKILRVQEKNYSQPQVKNSKRYTFQKQMALTLMWRAQIERIVGNYENMNLDVQISLENIKSKSKGTSENKIAQISKDSINALNDQQKVEPVELATIKEALKYATKGTREYAKITLVKAKILSSRGFTEKALKYVNKQQEFLESQNQNKIPDLLIMECYYVKGIIYFQKENIPESIKHFLLASQVYEARGESNHPDCSLIYQKLAKCYARQGKISQASSLFERAMQLSEINLTETKLYDTRFLKQSTEEPECLLMYNYCLHLKEQGDIQQSIQLTHQLMQNYKFDLAPVPEFVNKLLDYNYTQLNLKIKINKS